MCSDDASSVLTRGRLFLGGRRGLRLLDHLGFISRLTSSTDKQSTRNLRSLPFCGHLAVPYGVGGTRAGSCALHSIPNGQSNRNFKGLRECGLTPTKAVNNIEHDTV